MSTAGVSWPRMSSEREDDAVEDDGVLVTTPSPSAKSGTSSSFAVEDASGGLPSVMRRPSAPSLVADEIDAPHIASLVEQFHGTWRRDGIRVKAAGFEQASPSSTPASRSLCFLRQPGFALTSTSPLHRRRIVSRSIPRFTRHRTTMTCPSKRRTNHPARPARPARRRRPASRDPTTKKTKKQPTRRRNETEARGSARTSARCP